MFGTLHGLNYFLGLPPTLQNKDVSVDIFNTNPVRKRQRGVSPNPVHHCPQLCQEGNQTEPGERNKRTKIAIGEYTVLFKNQFITILPLEEKEVYVVVVLCKKIAQDAVRVTTFDLVGRQAEVDTLYKIPKLSDRISVESPVEQEERMTHEKQY